VSGEHAANRTAVVTLAVYRLGLEALLIPALDNQCKGTRRAYQKAETIYRQSAFATEANPTTS
jgi:hypothetical protein